MSLRKIISFSFAVLLIFGMTSISVLGAGANITGDATITTSSDYNEDYAGITCVHEGIAEHDQGTEWASAGELNPWIKFEYASDVWIGKIILCDRSNTTDYSKIVTITFSDGSSIVTPELDDYGDPYTVEFDPKNVTWVQFDVTEAGEISLNNGLGRVSIYDADAPAAPEPEPEPEPVAAVEEAPAPVVVAPAPVVAAPQTSDSSVMMLVASLLLVGTGVVTFNKLRVKNR